MAQAQQASLTTKEAKSRKLLSVLMAFVMATTLMVPHAAWADESTGGGSNATTVAMIGETPYESLQAAIDAAKSTDVVTLVANATESVTIAKDQVVTIDLGAFTLTNADGKHTIANNGALTIKGTGTVDNVSHAKAALDNGEGATAVLDGGSYTRSKENGQNSADAGGNSFYAIRNFGTMTINDGVKVTQNGHYSSMVENGYQNANTQRKLEGNVPTLTINGGEFSGGLNTIKNDDCGKLVIADGSFTNVSQAALLNWNIAEVSGGVFDATESTHGVILNGMNAGDINKGELTITGGTFKAAADKAAISQMGGSEGIGTVLVSAGSFSSDVTAFCADGYSCTLVDGMYVVAETPAPAVAKIGDKAYESLEAAAEQAVSGDKIELLSNCETEPIAFAKNVTLDLGGNTLTITSDDAKTVAGLQFAGAGDNALQNGKVIDSRSDGNQTCSWKTVHVISAANFATENVTIQTYKPDSGSDYNYLVYVGGADDASAKAISLGKGTVLEDIANTSTTTTTYGAVGVALIGTTKDASAIASKVSLKVADGVTIKTMGYAISGNGTYHGTEIAIDGGSITSTDSAAVYHPQAGTLVLNGGTLEGTTGIQFCSGEGTVNTSFDFNGGVVKGVGEDERPGKTGDGLVSDGAAISLVNRSYPGGAPSITINGGEFSSAHNEAVLAYTWSKGQSSDWAEAAKNISIAGGTYSSDVSAYVAEGLACSKISEGVYQVQKKIVNDDGNVEVQAPVVSEGNVPADKPGIPESDEALSNIAGSLGDALTAEKPVDGGVIAGNKIESGKDEAINDLVKNATEKDTVAATVVVSSKPIDEAEAVDAAEAIKKVVGNDSAVSFYDLSVKLVVEKKNADSPDQNASVEAAVTETAKAIPFQIKVDGLIGKDAQVVRYHDGKAEVIDATVDYATGVVSFAGDKFSTYAVALSDAKVTVTFDSNGGSKVAKIEVAKGGLVGAPEAPSREGYVFGGWYSDEALTTAWDFDADRATGDMTLYAKWNQATPDLPATASRLGGDDRYKTMALISKASFPTDGTCETVIIARGDNFPDALAAAGLAGVTGGQVLLTETSELTAETKAEIARLGAKKAYVIGDENSITTRTYNEIKALAGNAVRLGGETRLDTAVEIYKAGGEGWGDTAIVATGKKAADSLSASPVAYALKAPIFLADDSGNLPATALDALAKGGFKHVIVLGDKYSVSDATYKKIETTVGSAERIGGADRYITSQLTAERALKNNFTCDVVSITAGRDGKYADALVASSLSGKSMSLLLLVDDGDAGSVCVDKVLAANKDKVGEAYVLGDKYTVSDELLKAIEKAIA